MDTTREEMAAQLGSYDFQGHKSLGFWNGRQPEPGVMAAVYRLPADALCAQDAELLRNIIYAGVWNRYEQVQLRRSQNRGKDERSV